MYCTLTLINKTKLFSLCFKPLLFTIITSSLHCYSYKKDERATPGNIVTKWCPLPRRKIESLTYPITLPFVALLLFLASHSLSLSLCLTLSSASHLAGGQYALGMSNDLHLRWFFLIFPGIEASVKLIPKFHANNTLVALCIDLAPLLYSPTRFHFPSLYLPHLLSL